MFVKQTENQLELFDQSDFNGSPYVKDYMEDFETSDLNEADEYPTDPYDEDSLLEYPQTEEPDLVVIDLVAPTVPSDAENVDSNEEGEADTPVVVTNKYFTSGYDILTSSEAEDTPMLIEGLLPKGVIALLAASSDVGKSMLCRQITAAIAMGRETVIGRKLNLTYGRAAYITTEDGKQIFQKQFQSWNLQPDEVKGLINLDIKEAEETFPTKVFFDEAVKNGYDLVVVDVLSDTFTGNINDLIEIRKYLKPFKNLAKKYGTTVLFIHHNNKKAEGKAPSKVNINGSQGIEGACRCVLDLRKDERDANTRYLTMVKGNYFTDDEKNKALTLRWINEEMRFEATGETLSTANLNTKSLYKSENQRLIQELVNQLAVEGLSTRAISEKMKERGVNLGKTRIAEIKKQLNNAKTEDDGTE